MIFSDTPLEGHISIPVCAKHVAGPAVPRPDRYVVIPIDAVKQIYGDDINEDVIRQLRTFVDDELEANQ